VSRPPLDSAGPAVLAGGAFAAGVSLAVLGAVPPGAAPAAALAGGGAGVAAVLRRRGRSRWAAAAAVLLAAVVGALRGTTTGGGDLPVPCGPVVLEGSVRDAPAARRAEALVIVDADRLAGADGERPAHGGVLAALAGRPDLGPGDRVRLEASALRRPGDRPGPSSAALVQRDGVVAVAVSPRVARLRAGGLGVARALAAVRSGVAAEVSGALPPGLATLVTEVAFGIHGSLPVENAAALQDAGLIHLVATSGLKVAIVVGLLSRLAGRLLAPRRRLLLVVPAVGVYIAVAGGGAAAVRSALMAGATLLLRGDGRHPDPLALLSVTAALMLGVQPRLCLDVGFQLSFVGTLGILLLAAPVERRLRGPRWLVEPFAVTVAAELATVPVMASGFGVLSLVGPFANALAVPAVPLLVVLAWAGAGAAVAAPALGWPLLAAAGLIAAAILDLARLLAGLPLAAVHVARWPQAWTLAELAGLAAGGLAWSLGRRRGGPGGGGPHAEQAGGRRAVLRRCRAARAVLAGAGVAVLTVLVLSRPDGLLHLTLLDTGGSPAALVRTGDGATALVDGGADPARLTDALGHELPPLTRSLDMLVLTGSDRVTVAGLAGLPGLYRVGTVVVPDVSLSRSALDLVAALRSEGSAVVQAPPGAAWSWHGASWLLLAGFPPDTGVSHCALRVADASGAALLLGGLPTIDQEELASTAAGSLASDLVVTPPRGDVAPALLAAARPRLLAVPSARAPRLAGAGVRSTALDGSLEYAGGPAGLHPG
jgi:competence protein ComEC